MDSIPSTHPLTPPLTEEDWLDWLRLLRSRRVGISTFYRLMAEHGSAREALEALPGIAADAGVENYQTASLESVEEEWLAGEVAGAVPVAIGSKDYPAALATIADAPPLLWTIGDLAHANRQAIAIVGARNASSLGTRMTRKLAAELGEAGQVVVSGLARGIDTAAHLASLDTGTIAVMAGGVDVIYPAENAVLGQEIGERGLRVSEMPMNVTPQARHFPRRNRIVSGLAEALVVVEAAAKSGSLITARAALDQGRDVMAVPGHPFDARASGSNMLLRDGAVLVRSAEDVIEALARPETPTDREKTADTKPRNAGSASDQDTRALHAAILDRLGPSPVPEDDIIRDLGQSAAIVSPEIVALELKGMVRREGGGLLSRVN